MKNEEYIADFSLVARRALTDCAYELFKEHYLLENDWKACCTHFGLDRGTFFHEAYRIEQYLGRVYRELRPYPLFPLDEYFNSSIQAQSHPTPFPVFVEPLKKHGILRFPIAAARKSKVVSIDVKKLPLFTDTSRKEPDDLPLAA